MGISFVRFLYNRFLLDSNSQLSNDEAEDYHFLLFRRESRKNFIRMSQNIDRSVYAKKDMESGMHKMIGGRQIILGDRDTSISYKETENIKQYFRMSIAQIISGKRLLMENNPKDCIQKIENLVKVFSKK